MILLVLCLMSTGLSPKVLADDLEKLSDAELQLSIELLQTISAKDSSKDIFFSPYSIFNVLLLTYIASAGHTEKTLKHVLGFDKFGKPDENYITKLLLSGGKGEPKQYELASYERIFYSPEIKLKSDKKSVFKGTVAAFKTTDKRGVTEKTKGMIKDLVNKDLVNGDTQIVIVGQADRCVTCQSEADRQRIREVRLESFLQGNAAYFKGNWSFPFTGETKKLPFTLPDGSTTETLIMSSSDGTFQSVTDKDLKAQIISLPYKGDDISMFIILPTTKPQKGTPPPITSMIKKLTVKKFREIKATLSQTTACITDLKVPRFESEEFFELNSILKSLGGDELFTINADLTKLFEPDQLKPISQIVHKAKVNVHETGTEAAAASAAMTDRSRPPTCQNVFHADHPFAYIIHDKAFKQMLFLGVLNKPHKVAL